ncbi:hypothetical protein TIFTF001_020958 [Ficus carica]|uniref:Uncharacterized protein n=1 Tax=Ficus carica TaxID=3494 RepID=A0AA88AFU8_FICCA|nr:hypothetical protein TIFTF001_020958 [Ficus carica]
MATVESRTGGGCNITVESRFGVGCDRFHRGVAIQRMISPWSSDQRRISPRSRDQRRISSWIRIS